MKQLLTAPLRKIRRSFRRRNRALCEIILYHFVTDTDNDFSISGHRVRVGDFRQQLSYLVDNYTVLPLREVISRISEGGDDVSEGPFAAICFDDGYRNNLTEAYPVLEELKIPATVFICPSVLGNRDMLWRDKIRYLIENGMERACIDFLKGSDAVGNYRFDLLSQRSFYRWSKDPAAITDMSIQKDVGRFLDVEGVSTSALTAECDLFMSEGEIVEREWLDFGNHSWSHPLMTCLDHESQHKEIGDTNSFLCERGVTPVGLAMPFTPYNDATVAVCDELGIGALFTVLELSNYLNRVEGNAVKILHRRLAPPTVGELALLV